VTLGNFAGALAAGRHGVRTLEARRAGAGGAEKAAAAADRAAVVAVSAVTKRATREGVWRGHRARTRPTTRTRPEPPQTCPLVLFFEGRFLGRNKM